MKLFPRLIATALFVFTTLFVGAQSIPALVNRDGQFLIATTRATPPVNRVKADALQNIDKIQMIDEQSMKSTEGASIKSFSMTLTTATGTSTFESPDAKLTEAMKSQLKKIVSGSKISFTNISAIQQDGTALKLPVMNFEIL